MKRPGLVARAPRALLATWSQQPPRPTQGQAQGSPAPTARRPTPDPGTQLPKPQAQAPPFPPPPWKILSYTIKESFFPNTFTMHNIKTYLLQIILIVQALNMLKNCHTGLCIMHYSKDPVSFCLLWVESSHKEYCICVMSDMAFNTRNT